MYEPSTRDDNGLEKNLNPRLTGLVTGGTGRMPSTSILYDGSEGELYNMTDDPLQWRNLWNDDGYRKIKWS